MSRLQADLLLLIGAFIWGTAFVAQKIGMDSMGPFMFTGIRFALSAIILAPFALKELRGAPLKMDRLDRYMLVCLCIAFCAGVILQQVGLITTTVTNAGFLTSLYIIFTPLISLWIFKTKPSLIIVPAAPACVFGIWLLGGGSFAALNMGDNLVIASAFFFALHTSLISFIVLRTKRPIAMAFIQFSACSLAGFAIGLPIEGVDIQAITPAIPAILYTAILSGGIAYTFQIIAQQHTPAADAAVILGGEALFAAIAGAIILEDSLSTTGLIGCAIIFTSMLTVGLYPSLKKTPE